MAGGEVSEEEDEAVIAAESPKQKEDDVALELGEPAAGAEGVVLETEGAAVHEDPAASAEEIAKD